MPVGNKTIHEVDFRAQMVGVVNHLVEQNPAVYPFREARVEGLGTATARSGIDTFKSGEGGIRTRGGV